MAATFDSLLKLDNALSKLGHHPLTNWWKATLQRFYDSGAATLVARVGRGGAKSHTSCKVALNETLHGDWKVPPGEVHYWAFASTTREEAAQRLLLLRNFLTALRIKFDVKDDTITLRDMPRGFKVFAAQVGSVSGFRCYGYSGDELSKWTSGNDYANPADEVCASLNAMTITHPGSKRLLISSPFGLADYHAVAFDKGNNADQCVAQAPTWIANDSVTEESTRAKEPDPRVWSREYLAEPSSTVNASLDPDTVKLAFELKAPASPYPSGRFITLDPSNLRGDGDAFGIGVWYEHAATGQLQLVHIEGSNNPGFDATLERIKVLGKQHKATRVYSDDCAVLSLERELPKAGFTYKFQKWSASSKQVALRVLRRALLEKSLILCESAELKRQLLNLKTRLTPSGTELTFLNGQDFASVVFVAAHAIQDGDVKCSKAVAAKAGIPNINPHMVNKISLAFGGDSCGDYAAFCRGEIKIKF
jgi:hypothetical protein